MFALVRPWPIYQKALWIPNKSAERFSQHFFLSNHGWNGHKPVPPIS
jgi:hypothetical protein